MSNVPIILLPRIKEIYANGDRLAFNIFALGVDGTLSAWGNNAYGQFGNGTTTSSVSPIKVNIPPFKQLYIHKDVDNCYAVGVDGTLSAWGHRELLGNGATTNSNVPIKINLPPIKEMSLEISSIYALGVDGTLSAWSRSNKMPVRINLPPIKQITSNSNASYALGVDGTLSAWGNNNFGQLGNGTFINSSTPIKINLPPVKRIYSYYNSCYALGFDGILSAWGSHDFSKNIRSNIPIKSMMQPFQ